MMGACQDNNTKQRARTGRATQTQTQKHTQAEGQVNSVQTKQRRHPASVQILHFCVHCQTQRSCSCTLGGLSSQISTVSHNQTWERIMRGVLSLLFVDALHSPSRQMVCCAPGSTLPWGWSCRRASNLRGARVQSSMFSLPAAAGAGSCRCNERDEQKFCTLL